MPDRDNDMEHLQLEWEVYFNEHENRWFVCTTGLTDWNIGGISFFLPGDTSGEKTARYICDLHNSRLAHAVPTNHDCRQSEGRVT